MEARMAIGVERRKMLSHDTNFVSHAAFMWEEILWSGSP